MSEILKSLGWKVKSSSQVFHFITKIFVFDFMFSWILVLITVVIGLIIDLVILCLTTWCLNQNFHFESISSISDSI
jgi:hypothetical protein